MDSSKLVSVVTASYNMGQYLPIAVKSVLVQTYKNVEINVVDDGSTDNTKEVMKQFADNPRVNYHYQENQGQSRAKNKGIEMSSGDFIGFLDAYDMWLPDKLEKQIPLLEKNDNVGVVYSDVAYIDEKGNKLDKDPNKTYYSGKITEHLFLENFINFNSAVAKKECFDTVGVFDENIPMSIDWDLWLRISTKYEFAFINEPTFNYRLWGGQMSHNFEKRFKCIVEVMERFSREYEHLLSPKVIKRAWAHTYTERGWKARALEKDKKKALVFYKTALKNDPYFVPAYKEILKLALLG